MNLLDYIPSTDQIKLASFILSAVFGALIWIIVIRINKLNQHVKKPEELMTAPSRGTVGGVAAKWEEILKHINSTREFEWKFAVIESDKLVDEMLRTAGYHGETMGERLVNIDKAQFENLDGLWEAHKLRNKIVHDTNYFMRYAEAKRAVDFYGKALEELGII